MSDGLNPAEYFQDFERVWRYLRTLDNGGVEELMKLRGYSPSMNDTLEETGVIFVPQGTVNMEKLKNLKSFNHLGLEMVKREKGILVSTGSFLLEGRFILPIRSVEGRIFALVGWYPDTKKYITTPSALFSKSQLFFGLEQLRGTDLKRLTLFLVEGIFDSLALRSLGVPGSVTLSTMGSSVDPIKQELYGIFSRVIAVPDRDTVGRKIVKSNDWNLPVGSSYLRIVLRKETTDMGIDLKDIDDVVKISDEESLKTYLTEILSTHPLPRVVKLSL